MARSISCEDNRLMFLNPNLLETAIQWMSGVIEQFDSTIDLSIELKQAVERTQAQLLMQ